MAQTVASHAVAAFSSPVNGDPLSATVVLSNDNTTRAAYVDHDADPGIHLQSSALASRPAFGSAGRKWLSADSGSYRLFFDTGSAWQELTYLRTDVAQTFTQTLTVSGSLVSTGGIQASGSVAHSIVTSNASGITLTASAGRTTISGDSTSGGGVDGGPVLGTIIDTTGSYGALDIRSSSPTAVGARFYNANLAQLSYFGLNSNEEFVIGPTSNAITGVSSVFAAGLSGVILNEGGSASFDLRVEGDTVSTLLVVDASQDNVGIGQTPATATWLSLAAGTTAKSSLRIPHGAAPTSPVNGDMWTTTAGLFVRINGVTVGPLS